MNPSENESQPIQPAQQESQPLTEKSKWGVFIEEIVGSQNEGIDSIYYFGDPENPKFNMLQIEVNAHDGSAIRLFRSRASQTGNACLGDITLNLNTGHLEAANIPDLPSVKHAGILNDITEAFAAADENAGWIIYSPEDSEFGLIYGANTQKGRIIHSPDFAGKARWIPHDMQKMPLWYQHKGKVFSILLSVAFTHEEGSEIIKAFPVAIEAGEILDNTSY